MVIMIIKHELESAIAHSGENKVEWISEFLFHGVALEMLCQVSEA